jgi:hypothetical protein
MVGADRIKLSSLVTTAQIPSNWLTSTRTTVKLGARSGLSYLIANRGSSPIFSSSIWDHWVKWSGTQPLNATPQRFMSRRRFQSLDRPKVVSVSFWNRFSRCQAAKNGVIADDRF